MGDGRRRLKHPDQPIALDDEGVIRFKQNAIVRFLVDWAAGANGSVGYPKLVTPGHCAPDLNQLSMLGFSREDWVQFGQLIGYSVSGWSELSYVRDADYYRIDAQAEVIRAALEKKAKARKAARKRAKLR
jgi:hypothetical protein